MTYERREEIFSKELITIDELAELSGIAYSTAAQMMRNMKRRSDRCHIDGRIHVQDYLEYIGIDPNNPGARYTNKIDAQIETPTKKKSIRKSVCSYF